MTILIGDLTDEVHTNTTSFTVDIWPYRNCRYVSYQFTINNDAPKQKKPKHTQPFYTVNWRKK